MATSGRSDGNHTCPDCGGAGECYTSHSWTCRLCDGKGWLTPDQMGKHRQQVHNAEVRMALYNDIRNKLVYLSNAELIQLNNKLDKLKEDDQKKRR